MVWEDLKGRYVRFVGEFGTLAGLLEDVRVEGDLHTFFLEFLLQKEGKHWIKGPDPEVHLRVQDSPPLHAGSITVHDPWGYTATILPRGMDPFAD